MKKNYRRLIFFICALAVLFAVVRYTNFHKYFSLAAIKSENHFLKRLMQHNYYTAVTAFIGIFALIIGTGLPGSALLTLFAGYLFGALEVGMYALL